MDRGGWELLGKTPLELKSFRVTPFCRKGAEMLPAHAISPSTVSNAAGIGAFRGRHGLPTAPPYPTDQLGAAPDRQQCPTKVSQRGVITVERPVVAPGGARGRH